VTLTDAPFDDFDETHAFTSWPRASKILDLYCGAGGAGMGYHRAGFDVIGVDISPQRNYPFKFWQRDAIEFVKRYGRRFDAIHASPPCQAYSVMTQARPGLADEYPDLVDATREALIETGKPYVIENVPRSPLRDPVVLCGFMFGLPLYRHRLFEANFPLVAPEHPKHTVPASKAGHWKPGTIISVAGHVSPVKLAREAMGIDWSTRDELAEAIPPAYTEYVGAQLIAHLTTIEEAAA
jgi:DNA (cytosine-5)-methyltransferase 1